ncbi:hypothetical protein D3C76_1540310 [compost metagenome]
MPGHLADFMGDAVMVREQVLEQWQAVFAERRQFHPPIFFQQGLAQLLLQFAYGQ